MNFLKSVVFLLWIAVMAGCDYAPWGYTDIGEITKAPAGFEGRQIKIKGTVTDTLKVPLTNVKVYKLKDGTGEISIFASSDLPAQNGTVAVKGKVANAVAIGGVAMGTYFTEEKRF